MAGGGARPTAFVYRGPRRDAARPRSCRGWRARPASAATSSSAFGRARGQAGSENALKRDAPRAEAHGLTAAALRSDNQAGSRRKTARRGCPGQPAHSDGNKPERDPRVEVGIDGGAAPRSGSSRAARSERLGRIRIGRTPGLSAIEQNRRRGRIPGGRTTTGRARPHQSDGSPPSEVDVGLPSSARAPEKRCGDPAPPRHRLLARVASQERTIRSLARGDTCPE